MAKARIRKVRVLDQFHQFYCNSMVDRDCVLLQVIHNHHPSPHRQDRTIKRANPNLVEHQYITHIHHTKSQIAVPRMLHALVLLPSQMIWPVSTRSGCLPIKRRKDLIGLPSITRGCLEHSMLTLCIPLNTTVLFAVFDLVQMVDMLLPGVTAALKYLM